MNLRKHLMDIFDLTINEADIYIYGLSVSSLTPALIARTQSIPRPTVYHVLQTLVQKGFMTNVRTTKGIVFVAVHPKFLSSLLQQQKERIDVRERALHDFLPALLQ